jgi:Plant transposon protein
MRKDVECTFGILKGRFCVLKTGIRLHGLAVTDCIWLTCCALHILFLYEDGLMEEWQNGENIWESSYGEHDKEDVISNIPTRLLQQFANPSVFDLSGMGPGTDQDWPTDDNNSNQNHHNLNNNSNSSDSKSSTDSVASHSGDNNDVENDNMNNLNYMNDNMNDNVTDYHNLNDMNDNVNSNLNDMNDNLSKLNDMNDNINDNVNDENLNDNLNDDDTDNDITKILIMIIRTKI